LRSPGLVAYSEAEVLWSGRIAELRQQLGLDQPVLTQYVRLLSGAIHGDLGLSLYTGRPVTQMILEQVPATLQLAIASLVV
jgi:peptide/nickel transport system permease protein